MRESHFRGAFVSQRESPGTAWWVVCASTAAILRGHSGLNCNRSTLRKIRADGRRSARGPVPPWRADSTGRVRSLLHALWRQRHLYGSRKGSSVGVPAFLNMLHKICIKSAPRAPQSRSAPLLLPTSLYAHTCPQSPIAMAPRHHNMNRRKPVPRLTPQPSPTLSHPPRQHSARGPPLFAVDVNKDVPPVRRRSSSHQSSSATTHVTSSLVDPDGLGR